MLGSPLKKKETALHLECKSVFSSSLRQSGGPFFPVRPKQKWQKLGNMSAPIQKMNSGDVVQRSISLLVITGWINLSANTEGTVEAHFSLSFPFNAWERKGKKLKSSKSPACTYRRKISLSHKISISFTEMSSIIIIWCAITKAWFLSFICIHTWNIIDLPGTLTRISSGSLSVVCVPLRWRYIAGAFRWVPNFSSMQNS